MLARVKAMTEPGQFAASRRASDGIDTAPYRLDVFATDVADLVYHAGGWLFDQAALGWDVTAILADAADPRPLQILGVGAADLQTVAAGPRPRAQVLGAATEILQSDPHLRDRMLTGFGYRPTEVALWGDQTSLGLDHARRAQHRLSLAAYAFKQQALLAADVTHLAPSSTETFRCLAASRLTPKQMPAVR